MNANFFSPVTSIPNDPRDLIGLAISQGHVVSPGETNTFSTALIVTRSNVASIVTNSFFVNVSNIYTAVGGAEIIVRNGANVGSIPDIHPRTVAGLSQNSRYLYLLTLDGRQPGYSDGGTHFEVAQWLIRFGAYTGFILDGGGSTAMVISNSVGGPMVLNTPIDEGIPGKQRVVGNNIGVYALPLPDVVVTGVNWSPENMFTGTNVIFNVTVKNQGAGPTPPGVILGVGFLVDGVGVSWTDNYTNSLAAGASITLTANGGPLGTNVWIATSGAHVLTATVDDVARFSESNDTNNVFTAPFNVFQRSYAINSGGNAALPFSADAHFNGGNTALVVNSIVTAGVSNAGPFSIYQSERAGVFNYSLTNLMPGATHIVRLHFAEIFMNSAGQRVFNVAINGDQVLTNLDIFADAGAKYKALVKSFFCRADSEGKITINYLPVLGSPKSSGLEVIFASAPTNTPPVLAPVQDKVINSGSTLVFTNLASDPDIPSQTLNFMLDPGAPSGAGIDSTTGIFNWTTPQLSISTNYSATVRVTDNGSPPLQTSATFTITVIAPPRLSSITADAQMAELIWSIFPGKTYRLQFKNDLNETNWSNWPNDITAEQSHISFTHTASPNHQRFYRLLQLD